MEGSKVWESLNKAQRNRGLTRDGASRPASLGSRPAVWVAVITRDRLNCCQVPDRGFQSGGADDECASGPISEVVGPLKYGSRPEQPLCAGLKTSEDTFEPRAERVSLARPILTDDAKLLLASGPIRTR